MPSNHALLGPSGAHRWMQCGPSAKWEATLPDEGSPYAEEGTLAHSICEAKLQLVKDGDIDAFNDKMDKLRENILYSTEMDGYTDTYLAEVVKIMDEYKLAGSEPHLYIEVQLDLQQWIPEGFGTSDAVVVGDGTLTVIDFKYGKGVPVSAVNNPQMRCYALGAYAEFEPIEEFSKVRMVIIQPRLNSVDEETISVSELLLWGEDKLRPAAERAFRGEGVFTPGVEQCRFCKGRYLCRYNAAYHLTQYEVDKNKGEPAELTPLEIGGILEFCDSLTRWASGMKEFAETQAINGTKIPGWKVVTGRSNRKIEDTEKAAEKLLESGCTKEDIFDLKGISALEKAVGKKKLADTLGDLIVKPEGKPTLVKESDKRPELDLTPKTSEYFND